MKLKIKPTIKQNKAWKYLLNDSTKFLLFGGGKGGGKSWLGTQWLVTMSVRYPGTKWFIGRKELKSIKKANLSTFSKFCQEHDIAKSQWNYNGQESCIEFQNGSKIDFLKLKHKPSDPHYGNLGSLEYTGGWLEEASEIHFKAFDVLKTVIGRWNNRKYDLIPAKLLITANPSKNWLYRLFYKPWKKGKLSEKKAFVQSLYGDNPYIRKEYEKELKGIKDKATKQRLMLGSWEYEQFRDSLIEYDSIIDLFSNTIDPREEKYLTVDIARLGQNKTIIAYWKGWDIKEIWMMEKSRITGPGNSVSAKLSEIMNVKKIPRSRVSIDEAGVGGGVVDALRGVKGFVGNRSPIKNIRTDRKGNYRNLKSQSGYRFARKVNSHKITISADISEEQREQIVEELEQLRAREVQADKPREIIPKDEVIEMIGRSPDYSDCFIQRVFLELQTPTSLTKDEKKKMKAQRIFEKRMKRKQKKKGRSFKRKMV